MLLNGKTVLITGASKGIGRAIATRFASEGAALILVARDGAALAEVKSDVFEQFGSKVTCMPLDITNAAAVDAFFSKLMQDRQVIDVVVNNAGVMRDFTLQQMKQEQVDLLFQTNVFAVFRNCQWALKFFLRQRKGNIINLASIIGTNGAAGQSAYAASKAAVVAFSKSLSKELAPLKIRVNCIAPGFIQTDMTAHFNNEQVDKLVRGIGLRRLGTAQDVADAALYLASDISEYVTGQVLGVDGGMII